VVLVGPQASHFDLGVAVREAGLGGPVALVTAGWQERESDDQALVAELGVEATNLRLHARSEEVFAADPELAAAHQHRQSQLKQLHDIYRVRLEHAFEAARAISVRRIDPELLAEEDLTSVAVLRELDADHLRRQVAIHAEFEKRWRPQERPEIARHRRELAELIERTHATVVGGGHVASLLYRMKLFDVAGLVGKRPWVAAAAGAMVLTERIFIFHDFPPHGAGVAELLDAGLAQVPNLVVLPDPRRRLRLGDRIGISRFVQRVAPANCVALDEGARAYVADGRVTGLLADRLGADGSVSRWSGG
jgi:hypothetical protein